MSEAEPQVIDSPDGDPLKRGTIHHAVSVGRFFGPLDAMAPVDEEDLPTRLLVAENTRNIVVAASLPEGLADYYEDRPALRRAREALLDVETWRRP
jgi:hypothetical protein